MIRMRIVALIALACTACTITTEVPVEVKDVAELNLRERQADTGAGPSGSALAPPATNQGGRR